MSRSPDDIIIAEFYDDSYRGLGGSGGLGRLMRFDFPIPALEWVVNHNRNTLDFVENVKDSLNRTMLVNVKIENEDIFVVEFTEAMSGSVFVVFP